MYRLLGMVLPKITKVAWLIDMQKTKVEVKEKGYCGIQEENWE